MGFRSQAGAFAAWRDDFDFNNLNHCGNEEQGGNGDILSIKLLVSFCHQIARGMDFLSSNKVHKMC